MIAIAAVLLAAGRGSRYGGGKLAAMLGDKAVARHSADRMLALPFAQYIAVVSADAPPLPGYDTVMLDPPDAPQSRSLALGVARAAALGAQAVMIVLADMPLVPAAHFTTMVDRFDGDRLASRSDDTILPPALFGAMHFDALMRLTGDRGAGALLRDAPFVALDAAAALDIDRPDDLLRAAKILAGAA